MVESTGWRANMPFGGVPSFLRMPIETELGALDGDIAIVGVPSDEGSPFMPGTRFGPRSIREHSLRFASREDGYFDPTRRVRYLANECRDRLIVDAGDVDVLPTNVEGTFRKVTEVIAGHLALERLVVVLGGDHAITYPVVRAYSGDLHVVHLDAHLDYMPFVHGMQFTNAHAFRQLRRLESVKSLRQIGIRSIRNTEQMLADSLSDGNVVISMEEFRRNGPEGALEGLPQMANCYVSIDIDVLDMSLVPGCVSAEPEGMQYRELRELLALLTQRVRVVGFDVVEVNPLLDVPTGITSYLAAHLAVEFLGLIRGVDGDRGGQPAAGS